MQIINLLADFEIILFFGKNLKTREDLWLKKTSL